MGFLRRKKPPVPVDVVAMHEARTAGMCTLAPQVSAWKNWLDGHTKEVERERDAVVTDIERLETTKQGLEGLKGSIIKHRKIMEGSCKTVTNLLDSFILGPDPVAEDVIGLHEGALTELQVEHKESLTNVLKTLREEMDSMYSREESTEIELEGVTSKLERLTEAKKTLDTERDITEAFKENIAAFMLSKIAPPKTEKESED